MEPCELHEITGCSICSGLDKRLAEQDRTPTIICARFGGKCSRCGEWHEPGQQLTHQGDVWVCCAED
jgi:hypothetical protein